MQVFLEIVIPAREVEGASVSARQEIEEELHDALEAAGFGEVTGGGGSAEALNIDVEVKEDALFGALALIRQILKRHELPRATRILRHEPVAVSYALDE
jgi:hypothetical protein